MFEDIQSRGVDQILALMKAFQADDRTQKVDLVVGVYKDAKGAVPVMHAVKSAETRLVADEETKTYVGMAGDASFRGFVPELLLGQGAADIAQGRVTSLQSPSGSVPFKIGFDLFRVGDLVSQCGIHAAMWDSLRIRLKLMPWRVGK